MYDESIDHILPSPKPKVYVRTDKRKKGKLNFHVCIPLYHGIPKQLQSGWTRMGAHGVQEWDNTTNTLEYILREAQAGHKFDKNLYCGTCGRLMVKGRNTKINPLITENGTKSIHLI